MLELRPYQIAAIDAVHVAYAAGKRRMYYVCPTGTGKCLGPGTPVLLYDGNVIPVEDVKVGDFLMGPDSRPRRVLSLARGREMMYRVIPVKGDSYTVNESHVLSFKLTGGSKWRRGMKDGDVFNISVREYLRLSKTAKHVLKGWRTGVDFTSTNELPLDPYYLGLWLGDGCSRSAVIAKPDVQIAEFVKSYANRLGLVYRCTEDKYGCPLHAISQERTGFTWRGNTIYEGLKSLDVLQNKHIPHCYKSASRGVRFQVLAGLIDSDGSLTCNGYDYICKQKQLAEDVVFVARSLGLAAYLSECVKTIKSLGFSGVYYRVSITGHVSKIPCLIPRKQARRRLQKKDVLRTGIRVEPIGEGEYFGFEIDGDHLFLLGDFTVTHNTVTFVELIRSFRAVGHPAIVLAHREELLEQARRAILAAEPRFKVELEMASVRAAKDADVIIASIPTLSRAGSTRLQWAAEAGPSIIVCDEFHHFSATGNERAVARLAAPDTLVVGCTATDRRLDDLKMAGECVYRYEIRDAIADGWLCQVRGFSVRTDVDLSAIKTIAGDYSQKELARAVNREARTAKAIDHWEEVARERPTIVFCVDVAHSNDTTDAWLRRGYSAAAISGDTPRDRRASILAAYKAGDIQVLCNCQVLTEGFDAPETACVVQLRPTKSWSLYCQQVGRGTRLKQGRFSDLYVLDVVDAYLEHSLAERPGGHEKNRKPASVSGLLNLPDGIDLQGHTIVEAAELREACISGAAVLERYHPATYDDLVSVLREVDLFSGVAAHESAQGSRYRWVELSAHHWYLSLGAGKEAALRANSAGQWWMRLFNLDNEDGDAVQMFPLNASDFVVAVKRADVKLEDCFGEDALRVALVQARWRGDAPTEKQVALLTRRGVSPEIVATLSKGEASALISKVLAKV